MILMLHLFLVYIFDEKTWEKFTFIIVLFPTKIWESVKATNGKYRDVFRTQSNIGDGAFLQKYLKSICACGLLKSIQYSIYPSELF